MTTEQMAERIIALRDITKKTGMITKRTQNTLLASLDDKQLAEVAVTIARIEREVIDGLAIIAS